MKTAVLLAGLLAAVPLGAQYREARSRDYLFTGNAADARALWVNPAGLGVEFEAAVMGELVIDRSRTGDLAFAQLTAGFNSRGVAFGYRRDLYNDTLTGHVYRLGGGRGVDAFAVGVALSLYTNGDGPLQRGLDIGVRHRLGPALEVAAVVENIGKPNVHFVDLNVRGAAGVGFVPMRGIRLDAEGSIVALTGGGSAQAYRSGVTLLTGMFSWPAALHGVLDLDQDFAPARLTLALTIGGRDRLVGAVSGQRPGGTVQLDALSLTGVASRVPN